MQADDENKGLLSISIPTSTINRHKRVADRKGRVLFVVNKRMDLRQALPESSRLFD